MNIVTLPLLPLADDVVLPGMVGPLSLDEPDVRAAVDAARAAASPEVPSSGVRSNAEGRTNRVLLAPRIDGRHPTIGTVATIEQVGRLPGGQPAAVVRGERGVRIGV